MEEREQQLNPLAITHLLQHTLRSLCSIHENSHWVYAVFWRILPRNFPPPKWDFRVGGYDRARGNRRNWILVWEDGFCNFAASTVGQPSPWSSAAYGDGGGKPQMTLQPELFFKMSHEIYNYGEGLIGKVAADHGHKWVYKERQEQDINFITAWNSPDDSHPRTWGAQFQSDHCLDCGQRRCCSTRGCRQDHGGPQLCSLPPEEVRLSGEHPRRPPPSPLSILPPHSDRGLCSQAARRQAADPRTPSSSYRLADDGALRSLQPSDEDNAVNEQPPSTSLYASVRRDGDARPATASGLLREAESRGSAGGGPSAGVGWHWRRENGEGGGWRSW